MNHPVNNETFIIYAITCLLLCANLFFLWGYSGAVRAKTKLAINPEDSSRFGTGLNDFDPPEVARVLRAHANAAANIYPFLILGLVFVFAGGGARVATIIFACFVAARWAHTAMYLAAKQPARTICFALGAAASVALMIALVLRLV